MNDNEYYADAKSTETAAKTAVAAFTAANSRTGFVGPQVGIAAAQRAKAADEATDRAQRAGLSEHRLNNYTTWAQTLDGQAYGDWAPRAGLLVQAIAARDAAMLAAWRLDAHLAISQAQRDSFLSGKYLTPTWRHERSAPVRRTGIALLLLAPAIWGLTLLLLLVTGGAVQISTVFPLAVLFVGLAVLIVGARMSNPLWKNENGAAGTAASAYRVQRLGFDPLEEPTRLPRPWNDDVNAGKRLEQFIVNAYTNFPAPGELPVLVLPAARPAAGEPSAAVLALLEQFAVTDHGTPGSRPASWT